MPRTSRTSTASDGAASSSAAGDEEDGATKPRRLPEHTEQEYNQLRDLKRSFSQDMYAMAVAHLKDTLETTKTEGKGDCWLLTIMASFEVKDRNHVASLRDDQREAICTTRGAAPSSSGLPTRS